MRSFRGLLERRHVVAEQFQHFARRLDQVGAGAEDRLHARPRAACRNPARGMTPPTTTLMSGAAELAQMADQLGDQRLVARRRGWRRRPRRHPSRPRAAALSSGVWKSGPGTTSKPRSAKAEETRLAPRSWPSWPILATSMRGLRPSRRSTAPTPSSARAQRRIVRHRRRRKCPSPASARCRSGRTHPPAPG